MTDRTPQDPAASARSPVVPPGAARASVPGGPATSPAPTGVAGGKMSRQAQAPNSLAPDGTPDPETRRPGPAEVRVRAKTPAGTAPASQREADSAVPAGATRLRGQEALDAIRRAQSRSRRTPAARKPAATAKAPPPPAVGASLTATARCLSGCGWTAGPGDPAEVDKAAKAHTEKPPKHATNLFSEPVRGAA